MSLFLNIVCKNIVFDVGLSNVQLSLSRAAVTKPVWNEYRFLSSIASAEVFSSTTNSCSTLREKKVIN